LLHKNRLIGMILSRFVHPLYLMNIFVKAEGLSGCNQINGSFSGNLFLLVTTLIMILSRGSDK
jgi:hypothetical protein